MGIIAEGIEAEQWLLNRFIRKGIKSFQPDAISFENGRYILNEVKNQAYYKAPPFDGHGLPLWQIEARIKFYEATGIPCRLIVKEKDSNIIYSRFIHLLQRGEFFDTKGIHPRRIYNLNLFAKSCGLK